MHAPAIDSARLSLRGHTTQDFTDSAAMWGDEAVTAALDWGADHFGSPRAWCLISPENAPSIRVAERVGFREHSRATYHDAPTIIFQR